MSGEPAQPSSGRGQQPYHRCAHRVANEEHGLSVLVPVEALVAGGDRRDAGVAPEWPCVDRRDIAVELGPESARAHQARMAVHKVLGDTDAARAAGQRALALNPYDTDIIADYAAWLISQGEAEEGSRLLRRAEELFDARPAWVEVYRYLSAWMLGEDERAHTIARFLDPARSQLVAVVALIDAAETDDAERAAEAEQQLQLDDPSLLSDPEANLKRRGFAPDMAKRVAEGIRAGQELARSFTPNGDGD